MRVSDMNIDRIYVNSAVRSSDYQTVENHYHYYYELYYVRHGKIKIYVNNSLYTLQSGDFIMIPPFEIHYVHYLAQSTRLNIYFKYDDLCDGGVPFTDGLMEKYLRIVVIHVPRTYREIIHSLLDSMVSEENVDDSSTRIMLSLQLRQLLLCFSRYCIFHTESETKSRDEDILSAVRYINENFSSPITLDQLASMSGLSPSYFSKKFRATTGSGMKEYLNYVRLSHASTELISTNHSIMDVAINSGFSDSNYFKDAFKKMFGMSPRAFRNSRSGTNPQEKTESIDSIDGLL